ncbi:MAG: hypothetical protein ACOC5T_01955 [Elusimicrobiota bacterium]
MAEEKEEEKKENTEEIIEKEKTEKTIEEEKTEEEISPLDEAKKVMEENKKILAGLQEERKKLEKITANAMIAGKSQAGQTTKEKEESPKEYAKKIMSGKLNKE